MSNKLPETILHEINSSSSDNDSYKKKKMRDSVVSDACDKL